jgi:hypothetical protein
MAMSWLAAADGRYWIDVFIDAQPLRVMIDLGRVDPRHDVRLELERTVYDQLKAGGWLTRFQNRFRRDANGRICGSESGFTSVQLFDPIASQVVGPVVAVLAEVCHCSDHDRVGGGKGGSCHRQFGSKRKSR